jgi:hypothetical protein
MSREITHGISVFLFISSGFEFLILLQEESTLRVHEIQPDHHSPFSLSFFELLCAAKGSSFFYGRVLA